MIAPVTPRRPSAGDGMRWTGPRWVVADILDREPDGLGSRDLMARLRGKGSRRWEAVVALRDAGLVQVIGSPPRVFRASLTAPGREAVARERERRGRRPVHERPLLPPRDASGRVVVQIRDPALATLAPGDLWRRTMDLLAFFRSHAGTPPRPPAEYPCAS